MPRKKEQIDKDIEELEQEFNLSDLPGIGEKRLEKLKAAGIETAEDMIMVGAPELASRLDMDIDQVGKMILNALDSLSQQKKIGKGVMSAREFLDYYNRKIRFLSTGAFNLNTLLGGGFESGVLTEVYGREGSGKTQICMLASILAQLEEKYVCTSCDKEIEIGDLIPEHCPHCDKIETIVNNGGLRKKGEDAISILYMDTENSFRSSRILEMIYELGLVPTKEQSASEVRSGKAKEPLDQEAEEKAKQFLDNILYIRLRTTTSQYSTSTQLGSFLSGKRCKICYETHEGDEDHAFEKMPPIRLIIQDSLTSLARQEFLGRETLSIRQIFLTRIIKALSRSMEIYNCVGIFSNQIMMAASGFGDPYQPVGGTSLGHTSKHRIYLQRSGGNIVAKLVDSNNNEKGEALLKLTKKGIESAE